MNTQRQYRRGIWRFVTASSCASPRCSGVLWSETLQRDHALAGRRPTLPEWIRDLVIAPVSEILGVEVTRCALRGSAGGAPDRKRWAPSRAVRRAAPRRRGPPLRSLRGTPKMRLGARGRSATLRGAPSWLPHATDVEPDQITARTTKTKKSPKTKRRAQVQSGQITCQTRAVKSLVNNTPDLAPVGST
jgi:hypothetical protein